MEVMMVQMDNVLTPLQMVKAKTKIVLMVMQMEIPLQELKQVTV